MLILAWNKTSSLAERILYKWFFPSMVLTLKSEQPLATVASQTTFIINEGLYRTTIASFVKDLGLDDL